MGPLERRISKIEMQGGNRNLHALETGEPPHTWMDLYFRLCNHVPRKRPPKPVVPMTPEEAYQAMVNREADPDEPTTPEESWRRYLAKFS